MARYFLLVSSLVLAICALFFQTATANVIGIDMASDALKVAIVQPGTPLEIVTNFQSKRKTPSCVAFYKGERMFGSDASALMGRKPDSSFAKVYRMLGRPASHPAIQEITSQQYFPYSIYQNDTNQLTHLKVDETQYTPEELTAMLLQHVKDMTLAFGGKAIKDCVLTVPSFFTQHEKDALYTAAEIADLKVLSLIEENTAAALHYGIDRVFDQPHTVLYYNMGAGSVQVSIVTYSSYTAKESGKNKTIGQFEVVGKGWDETLGGFNFDVRLTDLLADRFNEVWQKKSPSKKVDVREFARPMTRLRLEASKVKEVLSANAEFPIRAEQLHADVDLVTKVTRSEFEAACADLFARLTHPIDQALQRANLTLREVHAVELLGGGVRMPKVKKTLEEYFKALPASDKTTEDANSQLYTPLEVGQHLNGDEAMALGAAFRAANLSTAFRVRKVGMTDISSIGIAVRLEEVGETVSKTDDSAEAPSKWSKYTSLYPAQSPLPAKSKTVAFHFDRDIVCQLEYAASAQGAAFREEDGLLAQYNITGIAAFAQEYADQGTPKVHLSFTLDASGRTELVRAEATLELPVVTPPAEDTTAASTSNTTATAAADAATAPAASEGEKDAASDAAGNATTPENKGAADEGDKAAVEKKAEKPKTRLLRRSLLVTPLTTAAASSTDSSAALTKEARYVKWSTAQVQEAQRRLQALNAIDAARRAKAQAMNDLEAYIYKVKNRLSEDEDVLKAVSTEEQRQEIVELANTIEDWLYTAEAKDASVPTFTTKHTTLQNLAETLFNRHKEVRARDEAVRKAENALKEVEKVVAKWHKQEDDLSEGTMPHITIEEKDKLLTLVQEKRTWLEIQVQAQAKASPYETPVFASADVPLQLKPVHALFDRLLKKPKPAPVVTQNETNTTTSSENEPIKVTVEDKNDKKEGETEEEGKEEKKEEKKEEL